MIGRPGRILFRLLSECVSAWMISSGESLCTLGSRYIFPQLFCLAVCDRNLWVVLSIWFALVRLCWVGSVSDFRVVDACQLSQALFYVAVFVHHDNS